MVKVKNDDINTRSTHWRESLVKSKAGSSNSSDFRTEYTFRNFDLRSAIVSFANLIRHHTDTASLRALPRYSQTHREGERCALYRRHDLIVQREINKQVAHFQLLNSIFCRIWVPILSQFALVAILHFLTSGHIIGFFFFCFLTSCVCVYLRVTHRNFY